ncbi:MAG: gamma-glutamyltransferase, partial [Bacteroidia bacterium]|nr:gamma-glutamyltransferase [Bacteroidia bacterium]
MKNQYHIHILAFVLILQLLGFHHPVFTQTYAKNGMVVSTNTIASQVGVDIMKKGGNAIDASIATAFALAVTHPSAGNIGGGGFLIYYGKDSTATAIDFREKAPLAATSTMYQDEKGQLIGGSNHRGLKAVGVPGTVAGLYLAHQNYGRLPWPILVQ